MTDTGNTPARTAYVNARLLDPESGLDAPGTLLTEGPRIADFGPRLFNDGLPEEIAKVDCGGCCLGPGLVDLRVQLREPGEEHKETIETASRAAAAGGITSMAALPNTDPVVDDVSGVEFVARRAREVKLVKVYTYGAITKDLAGKQMTELGLLSSYGAVAFTDGVKAVADAQVLRRALSYARTFDLVIAQRPEEPSLATGTMNGGELATRLGLAGIPAAAEVIMLERDLRLVELTGGRYHAANLSSAGSLAVIRAAKAKGLRITCDTAPHYFTLNENAVGDYRTFAKVAPPLRSEADRAAGDHRRGHQRPQPARPGQQAPALRRRRLRHRRPGDAPAAHPGTGPQGRHEPARGARPGDSRPRRHPRARGRTSEGRRAGGPGGLRPGKAMARRSGQLPQQVQELALRRPSRPG
jgi:dihydroorotase